MNKKTNIVLAGLVVLLGLGFFVINNGNSDTSTTDTSQEIVQTEEVAEETSSLVVSEDGKEVSYDGIVGETALETGKSLIEVSTKDSDFGEFVTGFGEVIADESANEFWAFYVNGKQSGEGAGTYKSAEGDTIQWKLESF